MPHTFCRLWIHAIWATKFRSPFIHPSIEKTGHQIMKEEFKTLGCKVRIINGMPDHVHSFFLLNPTKSLSEIIKQVKGGTSEYINQADLTNHKFAWQTGYSAYSVSESISEKVFRYISNQKRHHQKVSFQREYDDFIMRHGFQRE